MSDDWDWDSPMHDLPIPMKGETIFPSEAAKVRARRIPHACFWREVPDRFALKPRIMQCKHCEAIRLYPGPPGLSRAPDAD